MVWFPHFLSRQLGLGRLRGEMCVELASIWRRTSKNHNGRTRSFPGGLNIIPMIPGRGKQQKLKCKPNLKVEYITVNVGDKLKEIIYLGNKK